MRRSPLALSLDISDILRQTAYSEHTSCHALVNAILRDFVMPVTDSDRSGLGSDPGETRQDGETDTNQHDRVHLVGEAR